jgi:hypothetical protein
MCGQGWLRPREVSSWHHLYCSLTSSSSPTQPLPPSNRLLIIIRSADNHWDFTSAGHYARHTYDISSNSHDCKKDLQLPAQDGSWENQGLSEGTGQVIQLAWDGVSSPTWPVRTKAPQLPTCMLQTVTSVAVIITAATNAYCLASWFHLAILTEPLSLHFSFAPS